MKYSRLLSLLLVLMMMVGLVSAQVDRASITGTVKDATGAVISGVKVTATNVNTNAKFTTVSNSSGIYNVLNLPIGQYLISFTKNGFKAFDRTGVSLAVGQVAEINAALEVGSVTQVVTVTDEAPVLATETSNLGTNLKANVMEDLPLSFKGGRDIQGFAYSYTPTVVGGGWESYIGGSQPMTKQVLIDGTSSDSGIVGNIGESGPSMEAVQEFQIDTAGISAEAARTGGGTFEFSLKSGTNKFHGSGFGYMANEFLNANTWDNDQFVAYCDNPANKGATACTNPTKYKKSKNRFFDYGGSVGGPIFKDKTFFFAAIEKYQQQDFRTNPTGATVPTTAMLNGDFSGLLDTTAQLGVDGAGNPIYRGAIFNPATGNVFVGNIINVPFSARSQKVVDLYKKYYAPVNDQTKNNYPSLISAGPWFHQTQFDLKIDHNFSDKHHVSGSYIYTLRPQDKDATTGLWSTGSQDGGPLASAWRQTVIGTSYRLQDSYSVTPNVLNVLSITYNEFLQKYQALALDGGNLAQGIDLYDAAGIPNFPTLSFGGLNGVSEAGLGSNRTPGEGYVAYNSLINDTVSWVKGKHTIKLGGEIRDIALNANGNVDGGLGYTFSSATGIPTSLQSIQSQVGFGFSNFLLGDVDSANRGTYFSQHGGRKSYALFAQDDIKLTAKLTVNAGLRWDVNGRLHEYDARWANFDPNAVNPAFGGLSGALTWLNSSDDSFEKNQNFHQFGPHVGAAYQLTDKLVLRGAYGIFYVPLGNNSYSPVPYGFAIGYQGKNEVRNPGNNATAFQWDNNAYPGVYTAPTKDLGSYLPWGATSIDPDTLTLGRTQNWNVGVQYEIAKDTKIDVSYIGNIGRDLHDGYLDPRNYPTWETYTAACNGPAGARCKNLGNWISNAGDAANANVPYPYAGFSGFQAYTALQPFPQMAQTWGGIYFTNSPLGRSDYNALVVEVTKRGHGLNIEGNYTLSRTRGNAGDALVDTWSGWGKGYQDPYNYAKEALYGTGAEHVVKGYVSYELPVGKGKRFLSSSKLSPVLGGWQIGMGFSYQTGNPMSAIGAGSAATGNLPGWPAVYTNVASNADFSSPFKTVDETINWKTTYDPGSMFVNPMIFSNPDTGNMQLGNSPTKFSNWHAYGYSNEDMSLLKNIRFGADGRYRVEFRAEFFDVFNRHHWASPDMNFNDLVILSDGTPAGKFGHITGTNGTSRTGQLGLRFDW